jgi:hypothetical protein
MRASAGVNFEYTALEPRLSGRILILRLLVSKANTKIASRMLTTLKWGNKRRPAEAFQHCAPVAGDSAFTAPSSFELGVVISQLIKTDTLGFDA